MRFVISTVSVKLDQIGWLTEEAHFLHDDFLLWRVFDYSEKNSCWQVEKWWLFLWHYLGFGIAVKGRREGKLGSWHSVEGESREVGVIAYLACAMLLILLLCSSPTWWEIPRLGCGMFVHPAATNVNMKMRTSWSEVEPTTWRTVWGCMTLRKSV